MMYIMAEITRISGHFVRELQIISRYRSEDFESGSRIPTSCFGFHPQYQLGILLVAGCDQVLTENLHLLPQLEQELYICTLSPYFKLCTWFSMKGFLKITEFRA